jgi:outer membrane protein OmpA-like peptidoglycan-associated protein/opacity protein-like surface antigen
MALATSALASPALARDDSWYIEADAGAMIVEDSSFDIGTTANAMTVDHQYGYDMGGIIGYDFGGFRLEAEASFREADPDNLTSTVRIGAATVATGFGPGLGSYNYVAGDVNALSFMVNGMLDFGEDDGLQGFIGGGVGVARVDHQYSINSIGPGVIDDSDTGFAWQAIAGVRAPISDSWDVGLKYRFFNVDNVDLVDTAGRANSTRFRSHSLLGTLTYNFGGAPEVAPPPPPAPVPTYTPPPPVPVTVTPPPPPPCNKGPYIVFFDWDKSDITPEAAGILDSAVTAYANCDRVPIMLAGYADRSGTPRYNQGLSERRNASVRAYLTSRGISDGAISSQAFGESNPRVPTADGVRELQNRRVEITYGPGSGM